MTGRVGFAAGFALATGGLAGRGAAFLEARLGELVRRAIVLFAAFFAALCGAFLALFAACVFPASLFRDARAERRAAVRGELRFGRLALLPVGRFLAMAV